MPLAAELVPQGPPATPFPTRRPTSPHLFAPSPHSPQIDSCRGLDFAHARLQALTGSYHLVLSFVLWPSSLSEFLEARIYVPRLHIFTLQKLTQNRWPINILNLLSAKWLKASLWSDVQKKICFLKKSQKCKKPPLLTPHTEMGLVLHCKSRGDIRKN